jgi:Glycosyltransferase family 10 (fucosyltransferase).
MSLDQKLEILYFTKYFKEELTEAIGFAPSLAEDLCTVTLDHDRLYPADAVLFHIPNIDKPDKLPVKRHGQIWVAMSMESDANYPLQCDQEFLRQFDLCLSFKRSSDVPMLYVHFDQIPLLQTPPKPKTRTAPAVYFASNRFALNNRFELTERLMELMQVDSYGSSQKNSHVDRDTGRMTKLETISNYYFYLAFENSNNTDYVSEKMYDGLIAGTVPVYLGAANVDEYLPGDNCIIKVSDYPTTEALADHLIALTRDHQEYEKYLTWKTKPFRESFLNLLEPGRTPVLRRLCTKISEIIESEIFSQKSAQ